MNNEQKMMAKHLFFQTELSKTQIAEVLNISRRSLHYWIKEGNWQRLKVSAQHLPSLLAESCYHIMGQFTKHLLSESRIMRPITHKEADTLHKLTLTIQKLKNRTTLNENMEMFAYFMEGVSRKSPELVKQLSPHIDDYLAEKAGVYVQDMLPPNFNALGYLPQDEKTDAKESQLDHQDIMAWTAQDELLLPNLQQEIEEDRRRAAAAQAAALATADAIAAQANSAATEPTPAEQPAPAQPSMQTPVAQQSTPAQPSAQTPVPQTDHTNTTPAQQAPLQQPAPAAALPVQQPQPQQTSPQPGDLTLPELPQRPQKEPAPTTAEEFLAWQRGELIEYLRKKEAQAAALTKAA